MLSRQPKVTTIRRTLLAVGISVALHGGLVVAAIGVSAWRMFSMVPQVHVQTVAIDLVKDLPLGAPAKAPEKAAPLPLPVHKSRPRHAKPAKEGVTVAVPDAGAPSPKPDAAPVRKRESVDGGSIDGGRRRPGDLRSNGPEGSRVIALLHLDRLRAMPDNEKTIAALDQLLMLLPDRRRLIDGTGFDLYRDFDNLLIATPNPADASVTFLAVRHHLGEGAIRAGLDRGARAAQKSLRWHSRDGRPVGIRQQDKVGDPKMPSFERDDRILVLPEPNMAVIFPPAYATQVLGMDPANPSATATSYIDGGANDLKPKPPARIAWHDLVDRIDAEDTAVPEDAVFMMSATHLFGAGNAAPALALPPNRGSVDDARPTPLPAKTPVPEVLTLVVGAEAPYVEVIAEFAAEADAEKWEQELPAWRRQLALNPVVMIGGFSPLIRRVEISRERAALNLRVEATVDEIQRLLNLVSNLARTSLSARRL